MTDAANIRRRILPLAAAVCYLVLTAMNLRLLGSSIISCIGSLALAVIHPGAAAQLYTAGAAEYWIAGIAWFGAPVFLLRAAVLPRSGPRAVAPNAALTIIAVFVFIAFTAPVIAPLPPLAQSGRLQEVRLLPPFSRGYRVESVPAPHRAAARDGALEMLVHSADRYLLHRTITFARGSDSGAPAAAEFTAGAKLSPIFFIFGTDGVGRDILSRVVYGSRYSLGIGFVVVLISLTLGSAAGMAAGYAGGLIDALIMRGVDVLLSIPSLILALTLMAFIGQSLTALIIVLSATGWMGSARLLRGEVVNLRRREFISASRLLGTSHADILRIHILPNILPTIQNAGILQLGNIILAEASLSFLGLGIQQPEPSWGNMIADSMNYAGAAPFGAIFPGIALSILIVAVHLAGERSGQSYS